MKIGRIFVLLIFSVATTLCVAALLPHIGFTYAAGYTTEIPDDMDVASLSIEIAEYMDTAPSDTVGYAVEPDGVDISKSFKIYLDTDIFSLSSSKYSDVRDELEDGKCIYLVPLYSPTDTFFLTIAKGTQEDLDRTLRLEKEGRIEPLSPERREELEGRVGRWYFQKGVEIARDQHLDYYAKAAELSGIYDQQPLLVGGLPYLRYPVAVYEGKEGSIGTVVPVSGAPLSYFNALRDKIPGEQDAPAVFDYAELREAITSLPPEGDSASQDLTGSETDFDPPNDSDSDSLETDTAPSSTAPAAPAPAQAEPASPDGGKLLLWAVFAGMVLAGTIVAAVVIRRRQAAKRRSDGDDSPRLT
jgi:hypothetical protein